ncbi:GNAT family N-acetyltransferase [Paenibacillus sp. MMS18-CY102]|uniref:GNAT family N-acetyltransferase n=1 Tax=Paenibacillus sp. MMS18-CY102 TaxID=2682849 RepID=UPI00136535C2|nr:GNAT family N-acetyltransferase [Paenibacillus sp. MMS18-CY102]MWC31165.1 GNAT family N-acetyltransferase [Paenibacillus sp. MMS18-CY102]
MIRQLLHADIEEYWKLRLDALKQFPEAFGASYEEAKDHSIETVTARFSTGDENFILGAFYEGQMVGMVGFRREPFMKMRHKGVIWGMYVKPDCQGGGIAKQLLLELISRARQLQGLEQISLLVVDNNDRAKALYQSIGFTIYGKEMNAMKIGSTYVHEDLMVYRL